MAPRPDSLSDYALAALRRDLVEGRLVPGERIAADRIARNLEISHIPVREALRFLEAEGHLERDPHKRVRVKPITPMEAEELYRLRNLLEDDLHASGVPVLTDSDFVSLERELAAMDAALGVSDGAGYARANRSFHFVPFERADRPWTLRFTNNLWDAASRYQTALFQGAGWEATLQEHHRVLLEAMRARDSNEVNRIMGEHRLVTIEATNARAATGLLLNHDL